MANKMSGSLNHAMIDGPKGRAAQDYANRFGEPPSADEDEPAPRDPA